MQSRCSNCRRPIPFRLDQPGGAYCCPSCRFALWAPRIRNPSAADFARYEVFNESAQWSAKWIENFVKFAGNVACLRDWMARHTDDRWASEGIPELDGFFTARALSQGDSYWGGRVRVCGALHLETASVYQNCIGEALSAMRVDGSFFSQAVFRQQSGHDLTLDEWALCTWRCFWEGASTLSDLLRDDRQADDRAAERTAREYFPHYLAPVGFKGLKSSLDQIVLRELLRASLIRILLLVRANRRATFLAIATEIRDSDGPVFLFKPTGDGVLVEWIHQPELSLAGNRFFAKFRV